MRGLYSGFDAARASWEFPEGTCAGFLGYPSDPVSDGLESTTGEGDQKALDNDQDTAVKVGELTGSVMITEMKMIILTSRFASPLRAWAV